MGLSVLGALLVWLEPAGFLAVRSLSLYLGLCAVSVTLDPDQRRRHARASGCAPRSPWSGRMLGDGRADRVRVRAVRHARVRRHGGRAGRRGRGAGRCSRSRRCSSPFPLYVVFASRLGATTLALEARGRADQLLVAERVLTNVVLCALGVAIFAGGWQNPDELLRRRRSTRGCCGALLTCCKTWASRWLLRWRARSGLGRSAARGARSPRLRGHGRADRAVALARAVGRARARARPRRLCQQRAVALLAVVRCSRRRAAAVLLAYSPPEAPDYERCLGTGRSVDGDAGRDADVVLVVDRPDAVKR